MNCFALLSLMLMLVQLCPCSPSMQNCSTQNTDQSFTAVRRVKRGWVWEPLFATEEQTSVVPVYVGQAAQHLSFLVT
uniref:Secreted protein n=1 Tax=Strix occidentalis caurina TaxID=311401 RepID=A0A8D0FG55_STROC